LALVCFEFRYSDFEFCFLNARRSRDENILGDLPAVQRRVLLPLPGTSAQENQAPLPLLQPPIFGRGEPKNRRVRLPVTASSAQKKTPVMKKPFFGLALGAKQDNVPAHVLKQLKEVFEHG
jgi:hypothetical protein